MRYGISILLAGTMTGLFSLSATAQSPGANSGDSHRIVPFKESLQARGIGLSHASLAAALSSNDPKVRSEAAAVLAENHDPEAASLIKDALASESDPKTEAELAGVLMNLGDTTGMNRLTQMCNDRSLPDQTLSNAVFHLAVRGSGAQCIDELIRRLRDSSKLEGAMHLIQALSPLYKGASSTQQEEILTVLQNHLEDKEPATRLSASRALAQTAFPNSAGILKAALQREVDPTVRASMENDLSLLTRK